VLDEPDAIRKKLGSAVTDSDRDIVRGEDKAGITNLIDILAIARGVDALRRANPDARVAIVGASLGVPPVVAALPLARPDALVLVDGAQSTPHMVVDVQALGCDFFALSGHKMCGPTASGILYGKRALLDAMPPFMGGGEMIREVWSDHAVYNDLPYKFEAGTPNIAESIGLGIAVDYLSRIGMDKIRQHEKQITQYALDRLKEFIEVIIYGPLDVENRGGLVSFTFSVISKAVERL